MNSEGLYVIFYLMAIVMFVRSVTISKIFTIEVCMTLPLTFIIFQG